MERDKSQIVALEVTINFNSHAHVERDVVLYGKSNTGKTDFNSHAHVERDHARYVTRSIQQDFNSHAHVERDQSVCKAGVYV